MKKSKQNSKDIAYEYIKSRIINGEYAPKDKIDDTEISTQLQISKTPIRDAIQLLVSQNFLKSSPKVGTTVTEVDINDIYQLYEPLAKLHGLGAKSACLAAKNDDIVKLQSINDSLRNAIEEKNFIKVMEYDILFHKYIVSLANNPYLSKFSDELLMQIQRIEFLFLNNTIALPTSYEDHNKIIETFKQKNDTLAQKLMEDNWLNTIPDININTLSRIINALK